MSPSFEVRLSSERSGACIGSRKALLDMAILGSEESNDVFPEFESLHSRFLSLNDFSIHLGHDYRKLAITVPARLGVRKNGVSLKPDASTGAFSVSVSFHVLMPQQFFKNQEV